MRACTDGIGGFHERMASINPQKTFMFSFDIKANKQQDSNNMCLGKAVIHFQALLYLFGESWIDLQKAPRSSLQG